jgi:hypothetical protein
MGAARVTRSTGVTAFTDTRDLSLRCAAWRACRALQHSQECDLLPHAAGGQGAAASIVNSEAAVVREDGTFRRFNEVIGSDAFTLAVSANQPQVNRAVALKRTMAPLGELPETISVSCCDRVVRAAQCPVSTDAEVRTAYQHR